MNKEAVEGGQYLWFKIFIRYIEILLILSPIYKIIEIYFRKKHACIRGHLFSIL